LLWVLVVAFENSVTLDMDDTNRRYRICENVKLREISQLHSDARERSADVASLSIPVSGTGYVSRSLCHSICFKNRSRKYHRQECLDLHLKRGSSRDHQPDLSSEDISHGFEDNSVIKSIRKSSMLHVAPNFSLNRMINDCLDQIRSTLYLLFNLVIDLAEEHRE